jgi:hypothetical protein
LERDEKEQNASIATEFMAWQTVRAGFSLAGLTTVAMASYRPL